MSPVKKTRSSQLANAPDTLSGRGVAAPRMRSRSRPEQEHLDAAERIKAWTRERFRLADDTPILVSEVACGLPGCPPLETVVVFWTAEDRRHQFKLFKPLAEVAAADLPPWWMKDALLAVDDFGCECCG